MANSSDLIAGETAKDADETLLRKIQQATIGKTDTDLINVTDPINESLSGSAPQQNIINIENKVQISENKFKSIENEEKIDNVEDSLNLKMFKLVKNGDNTINPIPAGYNYFD